MSPLGQSWATVEEAVTLDSAIWMSKISSTPLSEEYADLIKTTSISHMSKGHVTVKMGVLSWELTPPPGYFECCEKRDDWELVPYSGFQVVLLLPNQTRGFQIWPCSEQLQLLRTKALLPASLEKLDLTGKSFPGWDSSNNLAIDDALNKFLVDILDPQVSSEAGTSPSSAPSRTISLKKHAKLIGKAFGAPFLSCVKGLEYANDISDVLDTILEFSAAYTSNEQILLLVGEESDGEDGYFHSQQVFEDDLPKRDDKKWLRRQVNCAARKCQAAAESTSEAAKAGVRMLLGCQCLGENSNAEDKLNSDAKANTSISIMDEDNEQGSNFKPQNSLRRPVDWDEPLEASKIRSDIVLPDGFFQDRDGNEISDMDHNDSWCNLQQEPPVTTSYQMGDSGQIDLEADSCSESSSWEYVPSPQNESNEDEADDLGAEISIAEHLGKQLENLDPFGKYDFMDDFRTLNIHSPKGSPSSDQEQCVDTKILERLASISSSISSSKSSNWTDYDINSSASSMTQVRTAKLQTVAEEPPVGLEISRLARSSVLKSASMGNVLQWCSCKFMNSSSVIELKFLVGAFMEDDIATLSVGIDRASPLYVKIYLGTNNYRHNLLRGDVRITVDQGAAVCSGVTSEDEVAVRTPVVGLSCYIPHLVREYLKKDVQERYLGGYEFEDGEVLTSLMQYVVAQMVFMKSICCICHHETNLADLTSMVPRPCKKPLCLALYDAWITVAPPMVIDISHVISWLRVTLNEWAMNLEITRHLPEWVDYKEASYESKVKTMAVWLAEVHTARSWLKVLIPETKEEPGMGRALNSGKEGKASRKRKSTAPFLPDLDDKFTDLI